MENLPTAHRLIHVARALIILAQADAPNYNPASGLDRCANCTHFMRATLCELYNFNADPDYICDSWQQREPNVGELRALIEQAGARHSRNDNRILQDIHDMVVKLGATCPP